MEDEKPALPSMPIFGDPIDFFASKPANPPQQKKAQRTINPYWDEVAPIVLVNEWDTNMNQYRIRNDYCAKYSWAIADPDSIAFVAKQAGSRIVEMGAGTGYWAYQLTQYGLIREMKQKNASNIDVIAYDIAPPDQGNNFYHNRDGYEDGKVYYPLTVGGPEVLASHTDRTLFLCWPPYNEDMAYQCLLNYKGNKLIYIGEGNGGCNADDAFFEELSKNWEGVAEHEIVQWFGIHDYIVVYKRAK